MARMFGLANQPPSPTICWPRASPSFLNPTPDIMLGIYGWLVLRARRWGWRNEVLYIPAGCDASARLQCTPERIGVGEAGVQEEWQVEEDSEQGRPGQFTATCAETEGWDRAAARMHAASGGRVVHPKRLVTARVFFGCCR